MRPDSGSQSNALTHEEYTSDDIISLQRKHEKIKAFLKKNTKKRQSVNPKEALRTKRLIEMMTPIVGSFVDQEGEYYAKKMHDAYNVDISPAEALLIAREAWRARRKRSIQRNWQMAYEYFRQANPVFDFFMEFSDKQLLNPGTIHFII